MFQAASDPRVGKQATLAAEGELMSGTLVLVELAGQVGLLLWARTW
jgi:hypothetical protein